MAYNDPILQEIKDRLSIADVIGGYIQLKKAGVNFKAACPFHNEKTASLIVSPQKQIWHCFGCGEGGDVFGFVMKYENLDFREALKLLAEKAGVKLPEYRPQDPKLQNEQELLLRINDFAARFYHEILTKDRRGKLASEYLDNRGLTPQTIKQWQIGFAPDDFHSLEQALAKKNVSISDAIKAGLSAKNERGQVYDRFRGRVTFPIFDYQGNTVGFSARILNDDGKSAKYVNSPETLIYQKSKILFGLNFAKNEIRKKDEVVIVEGQMDCIAAHQGGFGNVVASSGTALTIEQLNLLGRLTKNIKFCFDSDAAGQAASRRAGEIALKQGFRLKVIVLDKVKDPDELIKKSPGLWQKAVSEAVWFLDWQMDFAQNNFSQDPVEQKHFLSQSVIPMLGFIQDPLEQDHYVRKLAERFLISEKVIREQIKKAVFVSQPAALPAAPFKNNGNLLLEKEVLGGLLFMPEFAAEVKDSLKAGDFENLEVKNEIIAFLERLPAESESPIAKEAIFMVESQLGELDTNTLALKRELLKAFAMLKVNALKKLQQLLQEQIKSAELAKDKAKIDSLNQEFAQAAKQKTNFEIYL